MFWNKVIGTCSHCLPSREEEESHLIESILGKRIDKRRPGDVLHAQRESRASLAQTRAAMTEFSFAGQYQQNPIPIGGNLVKRDWLKFYEVDEEPARFAAMIQSWDTANKSGELNDYSVCTTWGVINNKYFLLNVSRKRFEYPDLKREVHRLRDLYQPIRILVEDKASGTQLIQELKGEGIYEIPPYTPPPGTDKIMRLHAQTGPFENGAVLLPSDAPLLPDYIAEITGFPGTKYADQVDSTTQALDYLRTTYARDNWINTADWDGFFEAMRRAVPPTAVPW